MPSSNDSNGTEGKPRWIRPASYGIALLLGLLALSQAAPTLGPIKGLVAAFVVGSIVLMVSLSLLKNIEDGLVEIVNDLKVIVRELRSIFFGPQALPFRTIARTIVSNWRLVLFQPAKYAYAQYNWFSRGDIRNVLGLYISLALLLLVNSVMATIVLQRVNFTESLLSILILGLPLLFVAMFREWRKSRQPLSVLEVSYVPTVVWSMSIVTWVLSAGQNDKFLTSSNILFLSWGFGLVLGSAWGSHTFLQSRRPIVRGAFFCGLVVALLIGSNYAELPQPSHLQDEIVNDRLLSAVYQSWESQGATTEYGDVPRPDTTMGSSRYKMTMSLPMTVATLSFIGFTFGVIIGVRGLVLWLILSPFFYSGWLLLELGIKGRGKRLLIISCSLDEWRVDNWFGMSRVLRVMSRYEPQTACDMLMIQSLRTPRRTESLKMLAKLVSEMEPSKALEIMITYLPYAQFERMVPHVQPSVSALSSAEKDQDFWLMLEHHSTLYRDTAKHLPLSANKMHREILEGLDAIADDTKLTVSNARRTAAFAASIFEPFRARTLIGTLHQFYSVIEDAVSVLGFPLDQALLSRWKALAKQVDSSEILRPLSDPILAFMKFAEAVAELKELDQSSLSAITYQFLLLQEKLSLYLSSTPPGSRIFGQRELRPIEERWGEILREVIRERITQGTA